MRNYILFFILFLAFTGCEINQKDFKPEDEFVKIYNDPDESLAYYPAGIIQTADKGFLIVSAVKSDSALVEFPTATIMKTNALGEVINTVQTNWLSPAPGLMQIGNSYAFVAMDGQNNGFLIFVNQDDAQVTQSIDLNITMPLVSRTDAQGRFIVLGYDYVSRSSIVALYNASADLLNRTELKVNEDMQAQIQYHMNKTGAELPFYIGEWINTTQNGYFINCFENYTLRTVFFDNNASPTGGDIYSYINRDALSSLVHLTENNYAFTRYYGGQNYLSLNVEVDPNVSQNFNDLVQNNLDELVPNAKVVAKKVLFGSTEYLIFASSTNSNSLVFYQYPVENALDVLHTEYFDVENKIEVVEIIQDTYDEGLIVLGKIYLTGRYQRPIVIKLKKEEFVH